MTSSQPMDLGAFVHPALFYHSTQEYLDCLIPFINEGLRAEQEILVAEPGVVSSAVWHKGFVGEFYRCAD